MARVAAVAKLKSPFPVTLSACSLQKPCPIKDDPPELVLEDDINESFFRCEGSFEGLAVDVESEDGTVVVGESKEAEGTEFTVDGRKVATLGGDVVGDVEGEARSGGLP